MSDDKFSKIGLTLVALMVAVGTFSAGYYNGQNVSPQNQEAQISRVQMQRLLDGLNRIDTKTTNPEPAREKPAAPVPPSSQPACDDCAAQWARYDRDWGFWMQLVHQFQRDWHAWTNYLNYLDELRAWEANERKCTASSLVRGIGDQIVRRVTVGVVGVGQSPCHRYPPPVPVAPVPRPNINDLPEPPAAPSCARPDTSGCSSQPSNPPPASQPTNPTTTAPTTP